MSDRSEALRQAEDAARARLESESDPFNLAVSLLKDASAADASYKRTQATNSSIGDVEQLQQTLGIYIYAKSVIQQALTCDKVGNKVVAALTEKLAAVEKRAAQVTAPPHRVCSFVGCATSILHWRWPLQLTKRLPESERVAAEELAAVAEEKARVRDKEQVGASISDMDPALPHPPVRRVRPWLWTGSRMGRGGDGRVG